MFPPIAHPGSHAAAAGPSPVFAQGFNFRTTAGPPPTDGPDRIWMRDGATYTYPSATLATRAGKPTLQAGWLSEAATSTTLQRNTGYDDRLVGATYGTQVESTIFRMDFSDITAAWGETLIALGFGDTSGGRSHRFEVWDGAHDSGNLVVDQDVDTGNHQYAAANGLVYTRENWVTAHDVSGVAWVQANFVNNFITLRIRTSAGAGANWMLNHFMAKSVAT